jgi:hypothetical protein
MYVRAFLILQKDFQLLTEYIETADQNLGAYSFRTHEFLVRTCIEIEANFKAILQENGYVSPKNWTMADYEKVNASHHLASYEVKVPYWRGNLGVRAPFLGWANGTSLPWYQAYNATKHDRHQEFLRATFGSCVDAMCGLAALLSSQFINEDFSPASGAMLVDGAFSDGFDDGIGGYFRIKFPADWSPTEVYDVNWQRLKNDADPFVNYPY